MSRRRYTAAQLAFLRDGYSRMRVPELTAAFNERFGQRKTLEQIRACLKNHRITCGRAPGFAKGERPLMLSTEQIDYLREVYREKPIGLATAALNERFGLSLDASQVRAFTKNHPDLNIRTERSGKFQPGHQSWNKGLSYTAGGRSAETRFRKGHTPATTRPMYSERIDSKDGYILIKVPERNPYTGAPSRFKHKHIWLWEQANGPVPKGMVVLFRDGDKMNCVLENLVLASRAELVRLNQAGYGDLPPDIKPAAITLVKVEQRAREIERDES